LGAIRVGLSDVMTPGEGRGGGRSMASSCEAAVAFAVAANG